MYVFKQSQIVHISNTVKTNGLKYIMCNAHKRVSRKKKIKAEQLKNASGEFPK